MDTSIETYVADCAERFGITGAAAGIYYDHQELFGCHGMTSAENPLPVNPDTLFVLGSVTKTYTATALMMLAGEGRLDLFAPVSRYLPELRLSREGAVAEITVMQLLNHTSGLDWGITADTGEGDDALAAYVGKLRELKLVAAPGKRFSYSQAGYNIAGRILEKLAGVAYEEAVASLILRPLGLDHSFFNRDDIMTRRFSAGHNRDAGGGLSVARLWRRWRGENPGGGLASSVKDLLRWTEFHLQKPVAGRTAGEASAILRMQQPNFPIRGSKLGDAIGTGWFLRTIDGVPTVGHGGSASGQFADLLMVPSRAFAVVCLSNTGPAGIAFNQEIIRWALQQYPGINDQDPLPLPFDASYAGHIAGRYANEVMTLEISTVAAAHRMTVLMKPEIRAASAKELPPDHAPFTFGILPGKEDEYIVTDGALAGQRGFFSRNETGAVCGVDLAGRLFSRKS